jgi:hypothetical protein
MSIDVGAILDQINEILNQANQLSGFSRYDDCSDMNQDKVCETITLLSSAIDRLSPIESKYRENSDTALKTYGVSNSYNIKVLLGILRALRTDYEAGRMKTIQEIIHADMFADFLEMAEHLLEEGYKDPAAVMIGGVLEEHLRKLCAKSNINIIENDRPKKADRLNAELASANVYTKLDQKTITAWLDLRNKAAHGKYNEYVKEQVIIMLQGIQNFMLRFPA